MKRSWIVIAVLLCAASVDWNRASIFDNLLLLGTICFGSFLIVGVEP